MRILIAILTGLHVLAHGIFGCCDHSQVAPSSRAQACVCHHADHAGHEHGESGEYLADDLADPTGNCLATNQESPASLPHHCIHDSCHWLAADVAASHHELDFNCLATPSDHDALFASALSVSGFRPDANRAQFSAPPLRLHLAISVLLV